MIHAFAALPAPERYKVLVELARISEDDAGELTDEEFSRAGEQILAMYDSEEMGHG